MQPVQGISRKMWLSCLAFFSVSLFCLTSAAAGSFLSCGVGAGGWASRLSGDVSYRLGASSLGSDLDLAKTKVFPRGWAYLEAPLPLFPSIRADAVSMDYSGSNVVAGLDFGDSTFDGSISTRLSLNQYDLLFYYHVPHVKALTADVLDVRWGVAARYFEGYLRVRGPSGGHVGSERKGFDFVIPMGYAGLTLSPPYPFPLRLHVDVHGSSCDGSYYYDVDARVAATLLNLPAVGGLDISGGYKWEQIRLKPGNPVDDLGTRSTVQGVFLELGARF